MTLVHCLIPPFVNSEVSISDIVAIEFLLYLIVSFSVV